MIIIDKIYNKVILNCLFDSTISLRLVNIKHLVHKFSNLLLIKKPLLMQQIK